MAMNDRACQFCGKDADVELAEGTITLTCGCGRMSSFNRAFAGTGIMGFTRIETGWTGGWSAALRASEHKGPALGSCAWRWVDELALRDVEFHAGYAAFVVEHGHFPRAWTK